MNVKLTKPIKVGQYLEVRGWITKRKAIDGGKKEVITVEGTLTDPTTGETHAALEKGVTVGGVALVPHPIAGHRKWEEVGGPDVAWEQRDVDVEPRRTTSAKWPRRQGYPA